jgi:hypothetical protein
MKLKKIEAICKAKKRIYVFSDSDSPEKWWIGEGCAIYSMRGMPRMTPDTILRIFDIPPEKADAEWTRFECEVPAGVSFEDYAPETQTEPMNVKIVWEGQILWFFRDDDEIHAINEAHLAPFLHCWDYLTFYMRKTEKEQFVLAVKVAMELKAIILPFEIRESKKLFNGVNVISKLFDMMGAKAKDQGATVENTLFEAAADGEKA